MCNGIMGGSVWMQVSSLLVREFRSHGEEE